ncbi:penicillin-binding transpeptidase domain-containing protein [Buchnera aphidicola (Pterocomma populeum)]
MQIINPEPLIYQGDRQTLKIQKLLNIRGMINDRLGSPLAITVIVHSIVVNPNIVLKNINNINNNLCWKALSNKISIPLKKIILHINNHKKSKFIYLTHHISPKIGIYIKTLKIPGITIFKEIKRYYPLGNIASQLVGFTNIDGQGIEGIEKIFNKSLTGIPGIRKIRQNKKGQIIENIPLINQSQPHAITLSIDKKLQTLIYNKLKIAVKHYQAESGTAILTKIKTGEILAIVNNPSYNPNDIISYPNHYIRNKAITDLFEAGSIIKPMVIMKALQENIITDNSIINTQPYYIKKHLIKDISYHKRLNITEIIKKSSNIGVSKIALSIPMKKLSDIYNQFGLEEVTNIGLIGERKKNFLHKRKWSNFEKAKFSFGYGFMITPLQLAQLYTTIGSYGIYHPLSILKVNTLHIGTTIFSKKITKKVLNIMENVTKYSGNGEKSSINGYRIAAKTGTAKKIVFQKKHINQYVSYTAGIAPASNPQFALIVIIDNPKKRKYYGEKVSAPIFSSIMQKILKDMKIKKDSINK